MEIAPRDLDRIRELYNSGLYLQAYEVAKKYGPFSRWQGTAARVLAGRLAGNLGARRLASALHLRAGRRDPADA